MRHIIFAITLLLRISIVPVIAQDKTPDNGMLTDSSRALQFQIGNDLTLISFQGTTISYKHHITSKAALRIGLSMSLGGGSQDNLDNTFASNTLLNEFNNSDSRKSYFAQLSTQYVWYLNPGGKLLLYAGTGPFLRYENATVNTEGTSYPVGMPPFKSGGQSKATSWSPGLNGTMGVEWFVTNNISLLAEYGLLFRYSWTKVVTTTFNDGSALRSVREQKQENWQLTDGGVKFGLTLYFQ